MSLFSELFLKDYDKYSQVTSYMYGYPDAEFIPLSSYDIFKVNKTQKKTISKYLF